MSGSNSKVVSDWDNEYARLARVASQLRSGISSTAISGGSNSSASALQTGLSRLELSLQHLPLAAGEIQRRKRLVQHLQQTTTTTTPVPSGGGGGGGGAGGATFGGGLQQQQQQSQMQMAMQQQDAMIDELAVGVGRLKNQSLAISDEANMHNRLLNEMDSNLDSAHQGLLDETARAQRLRDDASVWKLQLIVAGLVVLLVLLLLMGFS
jgi:hypothetical protein